jgi:hypothetical protein
MRHRSTVLSFAFIALLAGVAWAASVEEVTDAANALHGQYVDLQGRVDACEGGTCPEAPALIDEGALLHGKLDQLHADRASLPTTCQCSSLDELIGTIDGIDEAVGMTLTGFEEQN